ncbi:hypothetical protein ACP70R_000967 [Stipagrostis hirtigluma subsp. patula]
MDARCGAVAVAAATAVVRRPLQPRETNVAPSTVVVGKATELKTKWSRRPAPKSEKKSNQVQAGAGVLPSIIGDAQCRRFACTEDASVQAVLLREPPALTPSVQAVNTHEPPALRPRV